MSNSLPPRKVLAVGPMPPEKSAYALARYSRSPDSIEESLRWVYERSSEKFWEQFYFKYGHASIADLGHVIVCFENISELAAIEIEDEPLWDGQAKSSRYQDFSKLGYFIPRGLTDGEERGLSRSEYCGAVDRLLEAYQDLHAKVRDHLMAGHPRPASMKEDDYRRTVDARSFDVVRYLLPLAAPTNVGQVVSIRTLEKQISRLLSSPYPESVEIGEALSEACAKPPLIMDPERPAEGRGAAEPMAPTLARHARRSDYLVKTYPELEQLAAERLRLVPPQPVSPVDLLPTQSLLEELAATLLYRVSRYPYRQILETVREWGEKGQQEVIDLALRYRGEKDELLREFRSGYPLTFDLLMDIGAYRDLHRHRRCQQVRQPWTPALGYETPALMIQSGGEAIYRAAMEQALRLAGRPGVGAGGSYLLPFGARVRCLFKMDYAEVEYLSRLRSGVKGHLSYRTIAWKIKEALQEVSPFLASKIEATPPELEEPLTR